jgi:hypothetical protein
MLANEKWDEKPQVVTESWRENLLKAADHIEKYGHTKDILYQGRNPEVPTAVCLFGALNFTAHGSAQWNACFPHNKEINALTKVVPLCRDDHDLVVWNNKMERTAGEVIQALRQAAAI